MALEIKHKFQSEKPDGTDESEVRPSDWNDNHVIEVTGKVLIGKPDLGEGEAVEISLGDGLIFEGDELKVNPQSYASFAQGEKAESAVQPDQANIFTKTQSSQNIELVAAANVFTPDFQEGNFFSIAPIANFTLANPTNQPAVGVRLSGSITITQDATGGRTITLGNKYIAAGGLSTIVLSTDRNVVDCLDFEVLPSGTVRISLSKDVKA